MRTKSIRRATPAEEGTVTVMQQFRGGMSELMRQASRMQRKVEETRAANKDKTLVMSGANDKVKVTANFGRELVRIEVDPEFLSAERELCLDAVVATANAALKAASDAMEQEITRATGGVRIPGIT